MNWLRCLIIALLVGALPALTTGGEKSEGWVVLFNGKDITGWKLKKDTYTISKIVDSTGKEIKGAKKTKLDQKVAVVDAKGKPVPGARVEGKNMAVDVNGKVIKDAKIVKTGGRDAIVSEKGEEIQAAKQVTETLPNPTGGWKVEDGVLSCGNGPHGADLFTEKKFTDHELHIEFKGTSNSGVYLQGRYEIQVDNSFNAKPKVIEKDGKKVEVFSNTMCGALYSRVAPSKNMAKPPQEWQSFDITFIAPRGDKGKVTQPGRLTLVWNGEKVIDGAEITSATGGALDGKVTEPGPLMLQGDHGRVSFRNIKIRPLPEKK